LFGDKLEQFNPDGGDHTTTPAPDVKDPIGDVICFEPRRKIAAYTESRSQIKSAKFDHKLVVNPLDEYGKRYTLNGYVADSFVPSADGLRIYFNGCEGDEVDRNKTGWSKGFVLDLETKKVETVPFPENHILKAVSPDGKTFVTIRRIDSDKNPTFKTYLIPDGGKPVEILQENTTAHKPMFSPDGSKLFMETLFNRVWEIVILDVATRATKPVRDLPTNSGRPRTYVWSPDGTRWACLCYGQREAAGAADRVKPRLEWRVFVADLDGGNPKLVYRTDIPDNWQAHANAFANAFLWK
jgi:hypothetical protein